MDKPQTILAAFRKRRTEHHTVHGSTKYQCSQTCFEPPGCRSAITTLASTGETMSKIQSSKQQRNKPSPNNIADLKIPCKETPNLQVLGQASSTNTRRPVEGGRLAVCDPSTDSQRTHHLTHFGRGLLTRSNPLPPGVFPMLNMSVCNLEIPSPNF